MILQSAFIFTFILCLADDHPASSFQLLEIRRFGHGFDSGLMTGYS
jgi:hypothetical protein